MRFRKRILDDGETEAEVMSRRRAEAFRKFPLRFCVDFLVERSQPTMGSSTRRKHVAVHRVFVRWE